ncbi:hypothetical protein FOZG_15828 [Fusarium oxysporum Fo47]|uniref:Uncharacterized protein n=1 Tax=Fusarium oxysporum Fo47 TaxID=660027 RepID=W9JE62_FUSOX|nr:hypothetical protein FOZG_15828 [Fusarium oxysporum Fo47]
MAKLVDQMQRLLSLSSCYSMLQQWPAQDTNLALAGIVVDNCVETMQHLFQENPETSINNVETAKLLFAKSVRPITTDSAATLEDHASQFWQKSARWETLGLFSTAVSRAAIDMSDAQGSCKANMTCCGLSRLAMQLSDTFLDIAVSLDCLNGLRVLPQHNKLFFTPWSVAIKRPWARLGRRVEKKWNECLNNLIGIMVPNGVNSLDSSLDKVEDSFNLNSL